MTIADTTSLAQSSPARFGGTVVARDEAGCEAARAVRNGSIDLRPALRSDRHDPS